MSILIVYPCSQAVLDDINLVTNYDEMKAHLIYKNTQGCKHLACPEIFYHDDFKSDDIEFIFKDACRVNNIHLGTVSHILFAKLKFRAVEHSLRCLLDIIPGCLWKLEDKNIKISNNSRIKTIGHYTDTGSTQNYYDVGQVVAHDLFVPQQQMDRILRIHVDHNLHKRKHCFTEIKQTLKRIESYIPQTEHWTDLEVTYHDKICDIDDIGHMDYGSIPITELAAIYSKTNIAFVSHKETLGMYHLEMLSAGASVICLQPFLHKSIFGNLPLIKNYQHDLLDPYVLFQRVYSNRNAVLDYTFKTYTDKILKIILDRLHS